MVEVTALSFMKCTADPPEAGVAGPPPLNLLSPTAAWSASRQLLSAYSGPFYNLTSGKVDTLYDQSGNSRDLTQGTGAFRPTAHTSTAAPALYFAGSNQLAVTAALSSFITATTGYMIASVKNFNFLTHNPTQPYANAFALIDNPQNFGITFDSNSGSPLFYAVNNGALAGSVLAGVPYVLEVRHESGVLYNRINGSGETSASDGNTLMNGTIMRMGGGAYNGLIYEAATFATVPTLAQRDAMVQAFGQYIGASV